MGSSLYPSPKKDSLRYSYNYLELFSFGGERLNPRALQFERSTAELNEVVATLRQRDQEYLGLGSRV